MQREYWEDFDSQNRIKDRAKNFKMIDLDNPILANQQLFDREIERIFSNFDPDDPPLLKNYEKLEEKYAMPSKTLLELEKKNYRKYIQQMKHVTKVLVKRTVKEARTRALNTIKAHLIKIKGTVETEFANLIKQFIDLQEECSKKVSA